MPSIKYLMTLPEFYMILIPFVVYALFLAATRSGLFVQTSWPIFVVARLVLVALVLVIAGLIGLAHFSGAAPNSTYFPAHVVNGKLVPGTER